MTTSSGVLGMTESGAGMAYVRFVVEASKVAPIDKLSVVFVILLAAPVLGEALTAQKVLGGVLIAAGAVVLALS